MKDRLFRTNIFGGYRKEDVEIYIARLENELIRLKAQFQIQFPSVASSELLQQQKAAEVEEDVIILGDTTEEHKEEKKEEKKTGLGNISELAASIEQQKELTEAKLELERIKKELNDVKAKMKIES